MHDKTLCISMLHGLLIATPTPSPTIPSPFPPVRTTIPSRTANSVTVNKTDESLERDAGNPGVERLNEKGKKKKKRNKQS